MLDTQPIDDPLSPTTIIRQYLAQNKMPLTPENYRRVLEGNANNPGLIPGLTSNAPTSEAQDQADMKAAASRSGGGGQPLPTPPIPPFIEQMLSQADAGMSTGRPTQIGRDASTIPPPPPDARSMMPAFTGTPKGQPANVPQFTPEDHPPAPPGVDEGRWGEVLGIIGGLGAFGIAQWFLDKQMTGGSNRVTPEFMGNSQGAMGSGYNPGGVTIDAERPPMVRPGSSMTSTGSQSADWISSMLDKQIAGPEETPRLAAPPPRITGPQAAPEAAMATPNKSIQLPDNSPKRFNAEGKPIPPPAGSAGMPSSRGLTFEEFMQAVGRAGKRGVR